MKVIATAIKDVVIIEPQVFGDDRGYFFESYSQQQFDQAVRPVHFVQDNESKSRRGVLRGLHFQRGRSPIQTGTGRSGSGSGRRRRYTARIAHVRQTRRSRADRRESPPALRTARIRTRFSVLSDEAVFQYKCDNFYAPQSEGAIAWNDPDLGIDWQLPAEEAILSPKDRAHPRLKDADELFDYGIDYYA